MYESYYGLSERPFDLTSNPRFLFLTGTHREALSNLVYGITAQKGVVLLLGDAGTGKTTLIRAVLNQLNGPSHALVHLSNPTLSKTEFFEFVGRGFGVPADAFGSKVRLLDALSARLEGRLAGGGYCALVIDEAQSLPHELLEEIRLLSNLENSERKLLTVVLAGQPELADRLNDPSLRQLKQRVALRCQLHPLDLRATAAYISKRIRVAGGDSATVFTREAVMAIANGSRGIPRSINVICDNALVSGFAGDQRPVDRDIVIDVCRDFDLDGESPDIDRVAADAPATLLTPRLTVPGSASPARVPAAPVAAAALVPLQRPVASAGERGGPSVQAVKGNGSGNLTPSVLQYPGSRVASGSIFGLSSGPEENNRGEDAEAPPKRKRFLFF